ncbi:MAG: transglycosylase domain-containing protein, partial [Patescibacteria group bacterium]
MNVSYDYHRDRARFTKKTISHQGAPATNPHQPPRKEKLPHLRKGRRILLKPLLIAFFSFVILGGFALIAVVGWYSRDLPDPNRLIERNLPQSTRIYDRTGEVLLFQFHGEQQRTLVALDGIPDAVKWATIVAEDKNFYTHKGIDFAGILRALIIDVLRGGKVQGGSTITQQLIKNALLSNEKSLSRKAKEAILSYRIEQSFSKDEILQLYLNEIPYGSTAYGVSAAASMYFDKDVGDLSLAESTALA